MICWVIDRLSLSPEDTLWIVILSEVLINYHLEDFLKHEYGHLNIEIIPLYYETRGAAETLYIACQSMNDVQLENKTISLDCDTIYNYDILASVRNLKNNISASFYFINNDENPIFSYILLDKSGNITEIREKCLISNFANTGGYVFTSGKLLKIYSEKAIKKKSQYEIFELYTSIIIKEMISDHHIFKGIEIPLNEFFCVGTPKQLDFF